MRKNQYCTIHATSLPTYTKKKKKSIKENSPQRYQYTLRLSKTTKKLFHFQRVCDVSLKRVTIAHALSNVCCYKHFA
jgi:hypothetical protein